MIFKTFDSDKDTFSSQFGIFGKSFEDIGNRFKKVSDELTSTNNYTISNIANAWKNSSIKKDLSDKFIITKSDIHDQLVKDFSVYEKDPQGILDKLSEQKELVDSNQSSWQNYFKELDNGEKWQEKFVQENDLTKVSLEDVKNAQNAAKASAIAYNNGLKEMTIGAKATNIALKGLSIAGNMLVGMAIGWVISEVLKSLDDYIHRIENIKKAAEEAKSSISDIRDNFKSLSDTVNNVKVRYAELAQSVEDLGKASQSRGKLSNDDYSEFLDLSNQLADAFPQLTKGYDDNGNAILKVTTYLIISGL